MSAHEDNKILLNLQQGEKLQLKFQIAEPRYESEKYKHTRISRVTNSLKLWDTLRSILTCCRAQREAQSAPHQ